MLNSVYQGIVIQNNDPDKAGKIKVFVPAVSNTVYNGWNELSDNKTFSKIDADSSITKILSVLKEDLPWAESATNIFGGDSSQINKATTPAGVVRPSNGFISSKPKDAKGHTNFTPGDYSEKSAGFFSIPSVGSHVYVFFKNGDNNNPVYFAGTHGIEDWSGVLSGDYPEEYENSGKGGYKNKHVLNSTKHTLEFIDSDSTEAIRLSHFSGSNIQMFNDYTSKFTVGNDYTLINGDQFETVKGKQDIVVSDSVTITVGGSKVTINSDGTVDITSSTSISLNSETINILGGAVINIEAPLVNIN